MNSILTFDAAGTEVQIQPLTPIEAISLFFLMLHRHSGGPETFQWDGLALAKRMVVQVGEGDHETDIQTLTIQGKVRRAALSAFNGRGVQVLGAACSKCVELVMSTLKPFLEMDPKLKAPPEVPPGSTTLDVVVNGHTVQIEALPEADFYQYQKDQLAYGPEIAQIVALSVVDVPGVDCEKEVAGMQGRPKDERVSLTSLDGLFDSAGIFQIFKAAQVLNQACNEVAGK